MTILLPPRDRDLVAPLGLAFLDGPGGSRIFDGLAVRAWPEGNEARQVTATFNGTGVAGFHRLPGLKFDLANPFTGPTSAFLVEVQDTLGRFQSGRVRAVAPSRIIEPVVLRSAPTRVVPPTRLAFRAELWDAMNNRPAAFALVTIKIAGNGGPIIATGLADSAGRLLAIGDWPAPKVTPAAGPLVRWDDKRSLVIELRYNPAGVGSVPRLDLLAGFPTARAWNRRPDEPYTPPDLEARASLIFRSAGDGLGRLLVTSP